MPRRPRASPNRSGSTDDVHRCAATGSRSPRWRRRSWSSCIGGCSGSCDARAGRRPPTRSPPDGAQAATEAFAARAGAGPRDAALDFAWSTAATLEPWADGENFFPRILADVEAARSSVHILMFGWREGEVGMRMASLLERKLAEGVEVRVIVDGLGSRPYMQAREMFSRLAAAGAEIVVNDVLPPARVGLFPAGRPVLAPRPTRASRPSQALRHRRQRRLDGRRRHRGPLQRRPLPRSDGAGHR